MQNKIEYNQLNLDLIAQIHSGQITGTLGLTGTLDMGPFTNAPELFSQVLRAAFIKNPHIHTIDFHNASETTIHTIRAELAKIPKPPKLKRKRSDELPSTDQSIQKKPRLNHDHPQPMGLFVPHHLTPLDKAIHWLLSGTCPPGALIDLSRGGKILNQGAMSLAAALSSGRCPNGLVINLSSNKIGVKGATAIAKALESPNCPGNITLNLSKNYLGLDGALALADGLESGKCIALYLDHDKASPMESLIDAFEEPLKSGKYPAGLILSTVHNHAYSNLHHLSQALSSGLCPPNLMLNVSNLHDEEHLDSVEKAHHKITAALGSGKCPFGFHLIYQNNKLGDAGTQLFADALSSGQSPAHLSLDLSDNGISNHGAIAIATALQTGNCQNITINLSNNQIDDHGFIAIADALNYCPEIVINLYNNDLTHQTINHFENLLQTNTYYLIQGLNPAVDIMFQRNILLRKYPEFAGYIKAICHKAGYYTPTVEQKEFNSLKLFAGSYIVKNLNNIPEIPFDRLPADIDNFLHIMFRIEKDLSSVLDIGYERPNFSFSPS